MMLLTVGQVAERLHIHPNTLRRWANEGKIPVWRFSTRGDRRFSETDIEFYLGKNQGFPAKHRGSVVSIK
jgi:excisionase family DNA binding protein